MIVLIGTLTVEVVVIVFLLELRAVVMTVVMGFSGGDRGDWGYEQWW